MRPVYHDFVLIVDGTPGAYTVSAEGPGGMRVTPAAFRWEEAGAVRSALMSVQAGQPPSREDMEALGSALFDALFPRSIVRAFERAPEALPADHRLRLRLVVRPPELAHLPWELLYDPDQQVFLAPRLSYPIVRFVESGTPAASLLAPSPLRVLYVQANPPGTQPLDLEASERAVRDGLGQVGVVRAVRATTPAALRDVLREQPGYHVLHYDGHGLFHQERGEGYLFLHDEDGQAHPLSGEVLAAYLDGTPVRLVVLSACLTAAEASAKSFSGIAQQLMHAGSLPAVVAMQYAIPDASAIAFTREFYRAIADDYPVDAATVEGRKAVLEHLGSDAQAFTAPDWATPVLLMRSPDGDIFATPSSAPPQPDAVEQQRRLEAAMPQQAQVERQTEVRAMISLPDSRGLRAFLPDWTEAGDVIVQDDVCAYQVPVQFPVDPLSGEASPVDLFLLVTAPGFDLAEPLKRMRVSPGYDSGVATFFLMPRERQERVRVRVELFADEALSTLIGSIPLMTDVLGRRDELVQTVWRWATARFATARQGASPREGVAAPTAEPSYTYVSGEAIASGSSFPGIGEALDIPKGWEEPAPASPPAAVVPGRGDYDLNAVRMLLEEAFTADELRALPFYVPNQEFQRLGWYLGGIELLDDLVDQLLYYCLQADLLPVLLDAVERFRPEHYARFAGVLRTGE